nr:hypothetical protein [Clostridium sp. OM04-12AA]
MNVLYRKTTKGICVGRCYTLDNKLVIPDTIEGLPVTELDTYTFSQTVRRREQPPAEYEGEPEMCGEAWRNLRCRNIWKK